MLTEIYDKILYSLFHYYC